MADDNRDFWTMFEKAKQEVQKWPEWKQEIQVGIYSEKPDVICNPSDDPQPHSLKE